MNLPRFSALLCVLVLTLAPIAAGCGQKVDDGTAPEIGLSLPALTIQDDTPDLLLTWIDAKGDTHSALRPSEIPAEGKALVRVVVSTREEGTRDPIYVVNLNEHAADGGYAAHAMSRRAWEEAIEKRRTAALGTPPTRPTLNPTPQGGPGPAPPVASNLTVIVYGASWCGPCHDAERYLKSKGIGVLMKDVDASREAAEEMRDKLEKTNQRGGSIPVIDVGGQILVGFSKREIDRALAKVANGTVL